MGQAKKQASNIKKNKKKFHILEHTPKESTTVHDKQLIVHGARAETRTAIPDGVPADV
jgi:hypothetical protein